MPILIPTLVLPYFWANLRWKKQILPFCLNIGTYGILETLIPNMDLEFWYSDPKFIFWQILAKKLYLFVLSQNWHTWYLGIADSVSGVRFSKTRPQVWAKKSILCLFSLENLLLFLDIRLVFVLHSSAAFYKRFWKYEVPILVISFISSVLVRTIYVYATSFCSILTIFGFLSFVSI